MVKIVAMEFIIEASEDTIAATRAAKISPRTPTGMSPIKTP